MRRRAAFLDRDGVLIVDSGYPHRPADLILIDGAPAAVRLLNMADFVCVIVTNQAGVARGLFTEGRMRAFNAEIVARLEEDGALIEATYACPFHADAVLEQYRHPNHPERKPNPGMLLRAAQELGLDLSASIMIGDRESDMCAARRAGVRGLLFPGGSLELFVAHYLEFGGEG